MSSASSSSAPASAAAAFAGAVALGAVAAWPGLKEPPEASLLALDGDPIADTKAPQGPLEERWDTRQFEARIANPANRRRLSVIVVGTGGAYATPFLRIRDNSEVREASFDGVLRLRLLDGGYEWEFLAAEPERIPAGARLDRGSGSCH